MKNILFAFFSLWKRESRVLRGEGFSGSFGGLIRKIPLSQSGHLPFSKGEKRIISSNSGYIGRVAETFFFLTILLLPTYLIRFTVFSIPLNVLDILEVISILLCFLMFGHSFLCHSDRRVREERRNLLFSRIQEKKLIIIGFLCVLLGALISAYSSDGLQAQELGIMKSWISLPFLFVFLGHLCRFSFRKALVWYAISAGIVSVISFFLPVATAFTYDDRLRGWYESPNQLAMVIAPALVLLWFFWREKENFGKSFLFGFFVVASALVFTQSLGALLSVCSAIIFGEWILFNFCHSDQRVREEWRNPSFCLSRKKLWGGGLLYLEYYFLQ